MLKPETERVWNFLKGQPALAGFVLLGGSALALHLGHRLSEDLDFAWPAARLPLGRLEVVRRVALESGFDLQPHDDPAALDEFVQGGLDLHDYQQDFLVNGAIKVTFFAPERTVLAVLEQSPSADGPRLGSLTELFRTKSLLTARRSRTRDWFDLYMLMAHHGFGVEDYHETFRLAGTPDETAIGLQRLCSGRPHASDEGFESLHAGPPSLTEMQHFFLAQRDAFERREAARAWREQNPL